MWVIVAFPTEKMIGIDPPVLSIKNHEGFEPDFSVHVGEKKVRMFVEMCLAGFYAELLLAGDTKMVEALYQNESSIVHQSQEFLE